MPTACPKKSTQHQLLACLVLKASRKTDYRGTVGISAHWPRLYEAIGMTHVPHHTALQRAKKRLLKPASGAAALLEAAIERRLRPCHLDDQFQLDGCVQWQFGHAKRGSRVSTGVGEYFDEQVARAVGDLGLFGKARAAVDEDAETDDPGDRIQPARHLCRGCQGIEHGDPGTIRCVFHRYIPGHLPRVDQSPIPNG